MVYEFHELANIFPLMNERDVAELAGDIARNGQREPIYLYDGKILDGRNRYNACARAGVTPRYEHYDGDAPLEFVVSLNLHRRHLDESQRAMAAAKIANMRQGERTDIAQICAMSQSDTAEMLNVGRRSVQSARKVLNEGADELIEAVEQGDIAVSRAASYANYSKDEQREILRMAKDIRKDALDKKRDALSDATRAEVEVAFCGPPSVTCADALEWIDAQEQADLIITDPPYMTDVDDIESFAASWLPKVLAKMHSTGHAYVFIGAYPREISAYTSVSMPHQILVWTYRNTIGPQPADRYKQNWQAILYYRGPDAEPLNCDRLTELFSVQDVNAPDGRLGDRYHAWQKPMEIAERFVRHSTRPGDIVLDPFCCTGTFLLAASRLGRAARGCDINGEHLKIAVERGCVYE